MLDLQAMAAMRTKGPGLDLYGMHRMRDSHGYECSKEPAFPVLVYGKLDHYVCHCGARIPKEAVNEKE